MKDFFFFSFQIFSCHGNIADRKCDRCKLGYHTFPICEKCSCNEVGTVETICDSMSGQCLCKVRVLVDWCSLKMWSPNVKNVDCWLVEDRLILYPALLNGDMAVLVQWH